MRCLHFAVIFLSFSRPSESVVKPNNTEVHDDSEDLYTYGKILLPVGFKNITVDPKFIFEGTVAIQYNFDIEELLHSDEIINAYLPSQETCKWSIMYTLYCDMVQQGVTNLKKDIKTSIKELRTLHSRTEASMPIIPQLKNLPSKVKGNGTSDFMQALKTKEEPIINNATDAIKRCNAEMMDTHRKILRPRAKFLINKTLHSVWSQQITRSTLIKDILTKCQHNMLPSMIVNSQAFVIDLNSLRKRLGEENLEVAASVEKFFVLSLVDCSMPNEQELQVIVNVPVRHSGRWVLQTVKPLPFMFNGEKCRIFPFTETITAFIDNDYTIVSKLDDEKIIGGSYIVREKEKRNSNYTCLEGLLNNTSTQKLKNVCPFSCNKSDASISALQLEERKYLVSGATHMKIRCKDKEKDISFPDFGSLVIDTGFCKCEFTIFKNNDTRNFTSPRRYCTQLDNEFPDIVHVIPSQWTIYSKEQVDFQQRFKSIEKVFNRKWNSTSPIDEPSRTEKNGQEKMDEVGKAKIEGVRNESTQVEGKEKMESVAKENMEKVGSEKMEGHAKEKVEEVGKKKRTERVEEEKMKKVEKKKRVERVDEGKIEDGETKRVERVEKDIEDTEKKVSAKGQWYIWAIAGTLIVFLFLVLFYLLWRKIANKNKNNHSDSSIELYAIIKN